MLVRIRYLAYRWSWLKSTRLACPVIIVGNVSVGGTGKTPFIIWFCDWLEQQGFEVGLICKGYGGGLKPDQVVLKDSVDFNLAGDEALLLAELCHGPVAAGADRVLTAQTLLKRYPQLDLIISDDGLQHYALQRDYEIVIEHQSAYGNGWCLPAGPLREPLSRRDQADIVISRERHTEQRVEVAHNLCDPSQLKTLRDWQGRAPLALAGIGFPERFFNSLQAQGVDAQCLAFADHHHFQPEDLPAGDHDILVTAKDAVKLKGFNDPRIWVVEHQLLPSDDLLQRLKQGLEPILNG